MTSPYSRPMSLMERLNQRNRRPVRPAASLYQQSPCPVRPAASPYQQSPLSMSLEDSATPQASSQQQYHRLLSPEDSLYEFPILNNFGPNSPSEPIEPTGYDYERMDREMSTLHDTLPDAERRVIVNVKDSCDIEGPGMTFTLAYMSPLKHVFQAFKDSCCPACKPSNELRFKAGGRRLSDSDTPKLLGVKHDHTLAVRVHSKISGLNCDACKRKGFPTSGTHRLDGDRSVTLDKRPTAFHSIRILFEDPNGKISGIQTQPTAQLQQAMSAYAGMAECDVGALHFFYEDERLCDIDPPDELGMSNNSFIKVFVHQYGA